MVCFHVRHSLQSTVSFFRAELLKIPTMRKLKVLVGNTYNSWQIPHNITHQPYDISNSLKIGIIGDIYATDC